MKRTFAAAVFLLATLPAIAPAMEEHATVRPNALKWAAGPPALPPGLQVAVLAGDPDKEGPYVLRARMPAGYRIAAHSHPTDENVTVLSGSFHIGMGDRLDTKKGEALKAGGFVLVAKEMRHYAWTTAPTVIQVHGTGPFNITYVNPADDLRNASARKP